MITTGRPITAHDALTARVVDEVCAGDLGEGATRFAEALIDQGAGKRLTRDIPLTMNDEDSALLSQGPRHHRQALKRTNRAATHSGLPRSGGHTDLRRGFSRRASGV